MKKYLCLWLISLASFSAQIMAQPFAFDNVDVKMLYPTYWIEKTAFADQVIMSPEAVMAYNKNLQKLMPDVMVDLTHYKNTLLSTELLHFIHSAIFSAQPRYINHALVSAAYYKHLKDELNLGAIKHMNAVEAGFVVALSDLKTFPTTDGLYETADDLTFDLWQETRIEPATPVLILHTSKSKKFYYIQTSNYRGWVLASHVALAEDKKAWLDYQQSKDFIVVTGDEITLNYNPHTPELSQLTLYMGQTIPLVSKDTPIAPIIDNQTIAGHYVVTIPIKNDQGKVAFKPALISVSQDVSVGYLPYTKENVIQQAFKMLGQRYGWGGADEGRDCSSFLQSIYATLGFQLPRNTSQQQLIPHKLAEINPEQLEPTTLLFTQGHVLLYLGKTDGAGRPEYYAIHDAAFLGGNTDPLAVNSVLVTTLSTVRKDGKTFLESLLSANLIAEN